MGDHVLACLRKLMNWYATDHDDFRSPITRDMAKTKAKDRARKRTLDDHELRAVWRATEALQTPYGWLCRFLLLTATRLREAAWMARSELSADGTVWVIPSERSKSKQAQLVPLSQAAQHLLAQTPAVGRTWVFSFDGQKPINGFGKAKQQLDARVLAALRQQDPSAKQLPRWTFHDLRRTARSLMSRAGVPPRHGEMALGHTIKGVEGTYDRYDYVPEKRAAFESLSLQINRILDPGDNIVALYGRR
jgi:integrase